MLNVKYIASYRREYLKKEVCIGVHKNIGVDLWSPQVYCRFSRPETYVACTEAVSFLTWRTCTGQCLRRIRYSKQTKGMVSSAYNAQLHIVGFELRHRRLFCVSYWERENKIMKRLCTVTNKKVRGGKLTPFCQENRYMTIPNKFIWNIFF